MRAPGRPGERVDRPRRERHRRDRVMDIAFLAQLLEDRKRQRPAAVEPPVEPAVAARHFPHRAFEICRGLFQAVVEKLLRQLLPGLPNSRHAAIARVQRARVQRGAIERHSGRKDTIAKRAEQLAVVGQKATLGEKPSIQARRRGGECVFAAVGWLARGRHCRACMRRDHRNGATSGAAGGITGGAVGDAGTGVSAEFTVFS